MKKSTIITALTAIMMMAVTPAFAQELLAAGGKEKSNAMTIGWGEASAHSGDVQP